MAAVGKCRNCSKTVYQLEAVTAVGGVFHKGCFKCDVCGWQLTLTGYKSWEKGVYCQAHMPVTGYGDKHATGNQSSKDQVFQTACDAPKLDTVNNEIRGAGRNAQVADMALSNALKAPKLDTHKAEVRLGETKNSQAPDLTFKTAVSAPKLDVVGGVHRGDASKQ